MHYAPVLFIVVPYFFQIYIFSMNSNIDACS
jgi:hypothetical protein